MIAQTEWGSTGLNGHMDESLHMAEVKPRACARRSTNLCWFAHALDIDIAMFCFFALPLIATATAWTSPTRSERHTAGQKMFRRGKRPARNDFQSRRRTHSAHRPTRGPKARSWTMASRQCDHAVSRQSPSLSRVRVTPRLRGCDGPRPSSEQWTTIGSLSKSGRIPASRKTLWGPRPAPKSVAHAGHGSVAVSAHLSTIARPTARHLR